MEYVLSGFCLALLVLTIWRYRDRRADRRAMQSLAALQPEQPRRFDPTMVAHLPEPARRYFQFTIQTGAPLYTVAHLTMAGKFGMGSKASPRYIDMTAVQILAQPSGFVWAMSARRGFLCLSGSDSHQWTRFWLMGLVPVARLGGNADHRRSAFGRYVAESVFWAPASVLPRSGVQWTEVGANCARLTVSHEDLSQAVDVHVAQDGRPTFVCFQRWSNANPDKQYRLQPFGGYLSEFRSFGGFRLPCHVEAGNHFGTDAYFTFFVVDITGVSYPKA